MLNDCIANHRLELTVTLTCKLSLDLLEGLSGNGSVDAHQVGNTGLVGRIIADAVLGVGVGDGTLKLTLDVLGTLHQENTALRHGLGHLAVGSIQAHDTGTSFGDVGFGNLEHITVDTVEALSNVTGQLAVLLLVMAHGNQVRLVQQDICCHQSRIGKQAAVDILSMLAGFVLKLSHTGQFAKHGIAVQDPAQLCVLVDMRLDEQGVLLRIQAAGDVLCQLLQSAAAQISRCLTNGDGMQVSHEVEALIQVASGAPVLDGAQIVAQVQITGGLDAGEHSLLCHDFFHVYYLFFA